LSGKSKTEFFELAEWFMRERPYGDFERDRIVLQIPRVFAKLKKAGHVENAAE
jgi:hypothetical protein